MSDAGATERKRRWRERQRAASPPQPRTTEDLVAELDLSWRPRGACWGLDPVMFFPGHGDADGLARARAVCRTCTVRDPCVDLGIAELPGRAGGVYGGLSNRQLKKVRKFRQALASLREATADDRTQPAEEGALAP